MEDKDSEIARLQKEIRARDEDIHLAATYGKQLYEQKVQLSLKVDELISDKELLEQEKHSLQLHLETQIEAVKSQTNELELQRDRADSLNIKFQSSEKEKETLHKKIDNMTKENSYLKSIQEGLNVENKCLMEKVHILEKQMKNFEDQAEKSLCEIEKDSSQELQAQLNTYLLNNKELQDALSTKQYELEIAKKNENHLLQMVHEFEETISEKQSEISNFHVEMKIAKEEIEELQAQIEVFKFDQVDVNRRGNSVFAELDDRRHLVEREYKILRKKYEQFQKDYDENMKELDRARGQMAILQSMVSRGYQQTYIDKLEDSLSCSRNEINDLMHKLTRATKSNAENFTEQALSQRNEYDYLRVMLKQLQYKEKELQSEVVNLTSKNIYDNDKLIETQHLLYKSKEDLDFAKQEIFKLKQKVKELERGIMHKLPSEQQTLKPKIEILDGFKPLTESKENEILNKSKADLFADFDDIPAELELGEDGFHQVKPRRKSNRFKLQEFNRIKTDDEDTTYSLKPTSKKTELIVDRRDKGKVIDEAKNLENRKVKSLSKSASNRRNDNCAQQ